MYALRSCVRRLPEGRRTANGHGRFGHRVSNDEGRPSGRRDRRSPEADEIGLADHADETSSRVDYWQTADIVVSQDLGGLDHSEIRERRWGHPPSDRQPVLVVVTAIVAPH